MLFNSLNFAFFLSVCVVLYYAIPNNWRIGFLLFASYFYYATWKVKYTVLLLIVTLISFTFGKKIGDSSSTQKKSRWFFFSVLINLSILVFFKYYNFFNGSIGSSAQFFNISYNIPQLDIILPVGISFFIFKSISYSFDVYRGDIVHESNFLKYALYVSFFPQLLAGPIERSKNLLPQFYKKITFEYDKVTDGLRLFAWGLFKKVVIADRVGLVVDRVYDNPPQFHGLPLIVATFLFTYQIYCDFSGYSDMAIGVAKIFGFESKLNFDRPYFSRSVSEFWRKWHISLTSWFRDYLYIPLGGNRVVKWRWYYNLMIVFLVSGLWHGANWTFILWGALHGMYLLMGIWTKDLRGLICRAVRLQQAPVVHDLFRILITFSLVSFAWIFFRANNIHDALYVSSHILSGFYDLFNNFDLVYIISGLGQLGISQKELTVALMAILLLEVVQAIQCIPDIKSRFLSQAVWVRWLCYYGLTLLIIFYGAFNASQDFIYMQF